MGSGKEISQYFNMYQRPSETKKKVLKTSGVTFSTVAVIIDVLRLVFVHSHPTVILHNNNTVLFYRNVRLIDTQELVDREESMELRLFQKTVNRHVESAKRILHKT